MQEEYGVRSDGECGVGGKKRFPDKKTVRIDDGSRESKKKLSSLDAGNEMPISQRMIPAFSLIRRLLNFER